VGTAYNLYKTFLAHETTLDDAIAQLQGPIESARGSIVAEIDNVAAADVGACTSHAVDNIASIQVLTTDNAQAFALDASLCVGLAKSYIGAFSDLTAINAVGGSLNVVGPIALLAREYVGLPTESLRNTLIEANQSLMARLAPPCSAVPGDETGL